MSLISFQNPYSVKVTYLGEPRALTNTRDTVGPGEWIRFAEVSTRTLDGLRYLGMNIVIHTDNADVKGGVMDATPGATDDIANGWEKGDYAYSSDNDLYYVCVDDTAGAAVWVEAPTGGSNPVTPPPTVTAYWKSINTMSDVFQLTSAGSYTAANTAPVSPALGDIWLNTSGVTMSGILTNRAANWTGAAWVTRSGVVYVPSASAPVAPALNDGWRNTSGATIGTVAAGAAVQWDGAAWVDLVSSGTMSVKLSDIMALVEAKLRVIHSIPVATVLGTKKITGLQLISLSGSSTITMSTTSVTVSSVSGYSSYVIQPEVVSKDIPQTYTVDVNPQSSVEVHINYTIT